METPKVQGLGGFGLVVPDLGEAEKFYGTFGLEARNHEAALLLGSPGRAHPECVLRRGDRKRLHHVSFFIRPGDRDRFAEALAAAGHEVAEEPPEGWVRPGLWFRDPWGTWIHLDPSTPSPPEIPPEPPSNQYGRADRVDVHLWMALERNRLPLRIGHMLMFTADWEKAEAFYRDTLGLKTTDRVARKLTFMSAGDGVRDHHCFGLINGTHRGFQHASFQVASFNDIGFGVWRMREAGFTESFGPGRHSLASNLFHYLRDPWGSWAEYYTDMDKITDAWTCRNFETPPYVWGPEWSPEFWGGEMNANLEPAD